jgi:hypothetical protein
VTLKEELIQELEHLSELDLLRVLEYVRVELLKAPPGQETLSEQSKTDPVWQAYLESEQEREEVYRRLASS